MHKLLLTVIFILTTSLCAISQESIKREYTHDELLDLSVEELLDLDVHVQVVATQGEMIFNSSSTVTIISKQTILDYNFQSIKEAVQNVAGFSITNTYLKKNLPTARGILQDHYANKVLIMINGIPTFHAITGEGILDRFDIHDVERIEVLKGPASVLYGSNAYSGAINIILKTEKFPGVESHAGFGNGGFFTAGAHTKAANNNFKLFVAGNASSQKQFEGTFIDEDGETGIIEDVHMNQNITMLAKYKANSLLMNGYARQEGFLGTLPKYENGANSEHNLKGYLLNYRYDKELTPKLHFKGDAAIDWNQRDFSRDRRDSIRSEIFGYRINSDLKINYKVFPSLTIEIGALYDYRMASKYTNYLKQTGVVISDNNLKNRDILEQSYLGQINYSIKKLTTTLGVRYTNSGQYGNNISPRATLVYSLSKKSSIKAIYGKSYRAPSLFELYFINPDTTVFGNDNLEPEISQSFEIAYLKAHKHFFFQGIAYYAVHKNNIQRINKDLSYNRRLYTSINQYANGNNYNSYGFEIETKYNNPKYFQLFFNYSLASGDKGDTLGISNHYNFRFVPMHQISTGIHKSFKQNFFASALLNYCSPIDGVVEEIPAQYKLDLNIGFKQLINRVGLVHTLSVRNALNSTLVAPEYVRGNMNSIPVQNGISIFYSIKMDIF